MATTIDTSVGPLNLHSTAPSISPKVSRFGIKSGFVIPKNKLSGSLVPVFRTSDKADSIKTIKEESNNQVQRKTKWGIDMTQVTSIKKGRLLAYQTRLEQIKKKLKMESGSHQDLKLSVSATSTQDPSKCVIIDEIQHQNLEVEMREIIGEILQLNPSYNAPLDYEPLLKEAKVPIPIEVHPEFNFIQLLLGPESNTQKRLEEETGAKIRVYGTKSDTKEKCQIIQSDLNEETQSTYEKAHVLVSADNYNKIDAAVALLELLFTPASINPAVPSAPVVSSTSLDSGIIYNPGLIQSAPSYTVIRPGAISQAASPTVHAPVDSGPMPYETYGTWFSVNSINATPQPQSSYMPSQNIPFSGVHYPFGSVSNSPNVASVTQPPNQRPYHCPGFTPTTFPAVNQLTPFGTSQALSQSIHMAPMGTPPNRPPLAPPIIPPVGASNIQMTSHPHNPIVSSPCHQNQRQNFPSPSSFTVQQSTRPSGHEPTLMSGPWSISSSALSHNNATSAPLPVQHPGLSQPASLPVVPRQPLTGMVLNKLQGPTPMIIPSPPPRPVSGDFTFQPLRSQVAALPNQSQISVFAGCGSSHQTSSQIPFDMATQSALHQNNSQMWIGAPPFIPQMQRPAPLGAMGHGSSAQFGHFPSIRPPSLSHFPNLQNVAPPTNPSLNQRGPPSYFPDQQIPNLQATLSPLQTLGPPQNPMAHSAQSHGFLAQNRPIGLVGSGQFGNHVYNPFSPSPVHNVSLQKRNEQTNMIVSSDPDPEYDDLMASVGVR